MYNYSCDQHSRDIAGTAGDCTPNGIIDLSDITAVLDGFSGIDPCCCPTCSQSGGSSGSGGEGLISLAPRQKTALAGGLFEVDFMVSEVNDLRGYQLAMEIDWAAADSVTLEAIYVDAQRTDHVFAGLDYRPAIDIANARMAASMVQGGVTPEAQAYLATFAFRVSPDARGPSALRVCLGDASMMLDAAGQPIDICGRTDASISLP